MALDFIPASEAKLTVEKAVKEKPSVEQLTTIESPGRPIPANELDQDTRPKKKRKTKTPKKMPEELELKRDALLIITEKPQAALKIASALGNARKYSENNVPYYELTRNGKKIIVVCAVGHLFNLTYQKGQVGWPIFKMEWIPSYNKAAFTKRYYDVIKKLSRRAQEAMVATDYDTEGEVIGWNILRFIVKKADAKRMKFSTLTKPELEKSYDNALPTLDWGQAYAGETRHLIDWLYGINLSRALMSAIKKTGSFRILSIGRIQGPALKVIVDREHEISNFKSEPYWQVLARVGDVLFKHPKDIFDKSELESFKNLVEAEAKTTKKIDIVEPQFPFDLTSLQREAYAWHNISPSNTLKLAQSLYLEGLISYPRTSSQKIPQEINPKSILKSLEKIFPQTKKAIREKPIEGPKVDPAHPSIYPTGEFKHLEGDEKSLYELIVKRFIAAFAQDAKLARKIVTLTAGDKKFTASGMKVMEKGWTDIYPTSMEESNLEDLEGPVKIDEIKIEQKETQPPRRYTPTSLITLLEKKNLGTKTTRSLIVDTLFERGYLEGTSIKATPLGLKLIESLEKYSPIIINEDLTKNLEEEMEDIQNSQSGFEEKEKKVVANVEKVISEIAQEFKVHENEIGLSLQAGTQELRERQRESNKLIPCPQCKQGTLRIVFNKAARRYFVGCDAYPVCKATFSLPPNALIKKTDKVSPNNLPILVAIRKGKRPWEFEFNPDYKKEASEN